MLGFIKRVCYNFKNIECLKTLYFAYVRSHLEFACVIWSPEYDLHIIRIESIQKKFVLFALRRSYINTPYNCLPSYLIRCNKLNIRSLSLRRDDISIMFIFDLLTQNINSPDTLFKLNVYVPSRLLRNGEMFRVPFCRTNYSRSEPIIRMCRVFNSVNVFFDFELSRHIFKRRIINRD